MALTARQQARAYYSRERRRSLRAVPRLYGTHYVAPGGSQAAAFDGVGDRYDEPITFRTRVTNAATPLGFLFDYNGEYGLRRDEAGKLDVYVNGTSQGEFDVTDGAEWDIVMSCIPGRGSVRVWNQFGLLFASDDLTFAGDAWGISGGALNAAAELLLPLGGYVSQRPRQHLQLVIAAAPATDDYLINATAAHFLVDAYPFIY